jgi:hypothetical protein
MSKIVTLNKKETKENDKTFFVGVNKAENNSKGKAKEICFCYKENGHWVRTSLKYLAFKH